jgi:signal peptidase II
MMRKEKREQEVKFLLVTIYDSRFTIHGIEAQIMTRYKIMILISGLVVVLDQFTKFLILKLLPVHTSITVIPGFLDITHLHNAGVAFGMFSGNSSNTKQLLLMFASLIAVGVLFYLYHQANQTNRFMMAGFALLLGGAVGNLIDRIYMGKVVDFIDLYIGDMHWPAFNVADSAISVGVTILLYHVIFNKPEIILKSKGS